MGGGDQSGRIDRLAREDRRRQRANRSSSRSGRPTARLFFVSDRTGWWNLYRWQRACAVEAVHPMAAEFGKPQWTFSMVTYAFVDANRIAATYTEDGRWKLALIDPMRARFTPVDLPVRADRIDQGRRTRRSADLFHRRLADGSDGDLQLLEQAGSCACCDRRRPDPIAREWISVPEAVTFKVGDRDVHAFYYPPTNPDVTAPPGDAAAADRRHARRSDRRDARCARSEGAVLDQPRLRGARRELQRQHRLRPAVSRSPEGAVGHRRRRGRRRRRAGDGGGGEGGSRIG